MKTVCEHCHRESEKYSALRLDPDWLYNYIEDYYQRKIVFNIHERDKKEIKIRWIILYLFREFTGMKQDAIAKRFKINQMYVSHALQYLDYKDHDVKFMLKELRGELPVTNV